MIKINKIVNGHMIELVLEKIKDYARFGVYQVSRLVDGTKIPLYQESFSDFELSRILKEGYKYHTFSSDCPDENGELDDGEDVVEILD